nr:unnamed protein product [Naegleria fowleri]
MMLLLIPLTDEHRGGAEAATPQVRCSRFSSQSLIAGLQGSYSGVSPYPLNCPLGCNLYILSSSALGYNGPLGSLGPLGPLGPVGWMTNSAFVWLGGTFGDFLASILGSSHDGILSKLNNPLSDAGPLGDSFWDVMPKINDFTKHMQGLGVFSVLGPIGPLGALGPLGPLGPRGPHLLHVNDNGEYIDPSTGQVVTTLTAYYNSSMQVVWPLFEKYTSKAFVDKLSRKGLLDTSFMVSSTADSNGDTYVMTIKEPQYVTITITPILWAKNFFVDVYIENKLIHTSDQMLFTPWVQVYISKSDMTGPAIKMKVVVRVDPFDCGYLLGCAMDYTITVVGSTAFMLRRPHISYAGPYLQNCN